MDKEVARSASAAAFHASHARLIGADLFGELSLGPMELLTGSPKLLAEGQLDLDELRVDVVEFEKLCWRTGAPAGGGQAALL